MIQDVVEKYLDCGNPMCGFARIRRLTCGPERLLLKSCKPRGFCPSFVDRMSLISFIEEPKVIDRIIVSLKLAVEAERPPPPHFVQNELQMAAEERKDWGKEPYKE